MPENLSMLWNETMQNVLNLVCSNLTQKNQQNLQYTIFSKDYVDSTEFNYVKLDYRFNVEECRKCH